MVTSEEINFNERLGKILRRARVIAGISQTVLGEQVGVSFQQIQKYENGTDRMAPYYLLIAADYLNTPIASFFNQGPAIGDLIEATPVGKLVSLYSSLSAKYRVLLLQIGEAFHSAE